jgi:Ni,Fe-hydrogenase maturation factor
VTHLPRDSGTLADKRQHLIVDGVNLGSESGEVGHIF